MRTAELISHLRRRDVRLWVENDRLRYNAPKGVLEPELRAELKRRKEEILAFLLRAQGASAPPLPELRPARHDGDLPLSFSQQRLWFLAEFDPASVAYNLAHAERLKGTLDVAAFERSFHEIVRRHQVLRTLFRAEKGRPFQIILPRLRPPLPVIDLTALPPAVREGEIRRRTAAEARRPFDLAQVPLIRMVLLKVRDKEHVVLFNMHHIVSDGWSMGIFRHELMVLYRAFSRGESAAPLLPELPVQYADFAIWQRRWLAGEVLASELDYWREQVAGAPQFLELPTDRPRPPLKTYHGRALPVALSAPLTDALAEISREREATLFMALLAAFQVLLGRTSGQRDIVVGSPIAGRHHPEIEGLIGFFVNTLVLRTDLSGDPSFGELLSRVRKATLEAYEHQDLPFEKLVEELHPERNLGHDPLFQVVFALQSLRMPELELPGLELRSLERRAETALFDLTFSLVEAPSAPSGAARVTGFVEFNTDLFDATTIRRLSGHFETLLTGIVTNPGRRLGELPLLTASERQQLLTEWNDTDRPGGEAVSQRFAEQVRRRPEAVALVCGEEHLSYGELHRRAAELAGRLSAAGAGRSAASPEVRVGICLDRSIELVVGALAVLEAGGAYLPLDPSYPTDRLAYMLEDAGVAALVTCREVARRLPVGDLAVLEVEDWPEGAARAPAAGASAARTPASGDLAYVIYTSGSTGLPKGTELTQGGLANLVAWHCRTYRVTAGDRATLLAGPGFDASVWELWPYLASGAALEIAPVEVVTDPRRMAEWLERRRVTVSFLPTPLAEALLATRDGVLPQGALRVLLTGGDRLHRGPMAGGGALVNHYGPTEGTVVATWGRVAEGEVGLPPIGRPLPNTRLLVLDADGSLQPIGVPGELCIGGAGLARGYLGRPGLTAERFVPDPFAAAPGSRLYRSGDRVRQLADGRVEFLGRLDHQVKVRGYRIELGEIERVLAGLDGVREAVVLTGDRPGAGAGPSAGDRQLVAYVVPEKGMEDLDPAALRAELGKRLPTPMIPAAVVGLETLPLTANGKVDRAALGRRALAVPEGSDSPAGAPQTELEETLAEIWRRVLGRKEVGIHQNFFDLGGHSLLVVEVVSQLEEALGRKVSVVEMFEHPTVASLARALDPEGVSETEREPAAAPRIGRGGEIAVIGMAGRFPGAPDLPRFWHNLAAGVESISFFTPEELVAAGVPESTSARPDYVAARGVLADAEMFDAGFFEFNPREAQILDPQQRVFLETAWEALEDAGCDPERFAGEIGVFAGTAMSTYLIHNLMGQPNVGEWARAFDVALGNTKDFLTTRLSYRLDLHGPSVNVNTACSTSLVAFHYACQSLQQGECDAVLAGGVAIVFPQRAGYIYEPEGIESADGHCRAFDAQASGMVPGNGVGVVVLKRLEDALAQGDRIRAVVKGTAVNNDGYEKISFTAPSVSRQAEVIARAQQTAGVEPETITYVETHGTGTNLGDPVEIRALTRAFRTGTDRKGFCAIGSVKTNVGHLDSAAGITGLIKTVLALEHRQIPPSLHFETPNPKIDFAASPFHVNSALRPWDTDGIPCRAGVSSFGIGGTNAHAILEEAPTPEPSGPCRRWQLLVLSARSAAALDATTANLRNHLQEHPDLDLADVAFTLRMGRRAFDHRRAVVCRDREEAMEALATLDRQRVFTGKRQGDDGSVAFLFSGQGAQYVNMARELYEREATFRRHLDACCETLGPHLGLDLRTLLFPPAGEEEAAAERLRQTAFTQPALFVVEIALAELWREWGVRPRAMLGHSIGEYVAACLAGVFSLEDALALVAERGRLMQAMPAGAMLALSLPEEEVLGRLPEGLELAAVNAPSRCVVAGPEAAVEALKQQLAGDGIRCRRLHTSHAFHSPMMEPAVAPFREAVAQVRLQPPQVRYLSNVTGTWIRDREATDPGYWARHLRSTVRFADAVAELLRESPAALLEVGPGNTLINLAREPARGVEAPPVLVSSLPHPGDRRSHLAHLLAAAGRLGVIGVEIDGGGFYAHERRSKVPLPAYPFERQRYWIAPGDGAFGAVDQLIKKADLGEWFYLPSWRRSAPLLPARIDATDPRPWLVFLSRAPLGLRLAERLVETGREVIPIQPGAGFERLPDGSYRIDPGRPEDYEALFRELRSRGESPAGVAHLWSLTAEPPVDLDAAGCERMQALGFYSLIFLAQALGQEGPAEPVQIEVVTNHLHEVAGGEALAPEKATLLGPCTVIPQELLHLRCRSIDVQVPEPGSRQEEELVGRLLAELAHPPAEGVVAYRGPHRWVQTFEARRFEALNPEQRTLGESDEAPGGAFPARLRPGGVYLITGGLGGIGLAIARYLADSAQARLVLVGRTPVPQREAWDDWLADHGEDDAVSRRIRGLRELEASGAEVLPLAADVADDGQMVSAVERAERRFGAIHGVIHAAGVAGGGVIALKTRQEAERVLRPKVRGVLVLDQIFRHRELDFLILFSSLSAIVGGAGQVDYCAANLFLGAYAHHRFAQGRFTVAIDWDSWSEVGMAVETEIPGEIRQLRAAALQLGIQNAEGQEAFERILFQATGPEVVVATKDLATLLARIRERPAEPPAEERQARPELATDYQAPGNETESLVAEIWQDLLGIERIGIQDNFFDLGGHSLVATRLLSRLRDALEVDLTLKRLFETPTIAELAEQIETLRWARKAAATADRATADRATADRATADRATDECEEGEL